MTSFYAERIEMFYNKRMTYPDMYSRTDLPEFDDIQAQFRKFYGDLAVSGSASALECGYDFYGTEQLVFGADYPLGTDGGRVNYEVALSMVEEIDISSTEKEAILSGNIKDII